MPISQTCRRLTLCVALIVYGAAGAAVEPAGEPSSRLLPLESSERVFRVAADDRRAEATQVLRPAPEDGWRLSLEGFNDVYLTRTADGGIGITQVRIEEQNRRIVFSEPVPLLPATVRAGDTLAVETRVQVYELASGRQTHTGTVEHRLSVAGPAELALASGPQQGYRISLRQTMRFDFVSVRVSLDTGYLPEWGIVQRQLAYRVEAFGIDVMTRSHSAELAGAAPRQIVAAH